jgi:diguanylate cyclase (GGDEF)-like protein/PAS domain S-box-containing protein
MPNGSKDRHRSVHILFVQPNGQNVERYVHELRVAGFQTKADFVETPEQFIAYLSLQPYDLVVAESPSPKWEATQVLALLHQSGRQIPLIFVSETFERETVADFITKGAYDCIEFDHLGHLPVAIRRALDAGSLRIERDRAEKMLKHSEAKYRALIGNLTYGMCRCGLDGNFLNVNQALITMLGYPTREELMEANLLSAIILEPDMHARLLGKAGQENGSNPFEIEWKSLNGTPLKVRLTGREVKAEHELPDSYEVIVEDITKQRALEEQLRQQATRDALTGLANYRQLVDELSTEIKRSKRTAREFALLLFDLDGLKIINDQYGHLVGSNALCRLADALCIGSRDIDTPARFGGDEFALVLPETDSDAAIRVARRICDSLARDGKEPRLSMSVGIAIYPENGKTLEMLLETADRALYKMKGARTNVH